MSRRQYDLGFQFWQILHDFCHERRNYGRLQEEIIINTMILPRIAGRLLSDWSHPSRMRDRSIRMLVLKGFSASFEVKN
jgi:hypothetical protein